MGTTSTNNKVTKPSKKCGFSNAFEFDSQIILNPKNSKLYRKEIYLMFLRLLGINMGYMGASY